MAAGYALFRRYLLDWRTELNLPLLLLIDERQSRPQDLCDDARMRRHSRRT